MKIVKQVNELTTPFNPAQMLTCCMQDQQKPLPNVRIMSAMSPDPAATGNCK